jgi:PAS domain-containing protein
MFISRGRARNTITAAIGVFLVTVLGAMGTWILILRRQARERRKAEQELRWRTAFFEAQVHSAIDGILVVDSQGRKILQNQRMTDLWKIPPHIAADPDDSRASAVRSEAGSRIRSRVPRKIAHLYAHPGRNQRWTRLN